MTKKNEEFEPNPRFVTLRYRKTDNYNPADVAENGVDVNDYATVLCMPLREMLSTEIINLGNAVAEITHESGWTKRGVRQVNPGDILYAGEDAWLFIRMKDTPLFTAVGARVEMLGPTKKNSDLVIVNLEADSACPN